ncbi:Uncharacterised protein [Weissella viridescens]|uniref:Uncharacterized protein n=1 Tax=Weissella viridescens TaxID=1629 RepID=A0A380NXP5_WEIVI|nr:Uncharacterised protein [Weissella viridescens]
MSCIGFLFEVNYYAENHHTERLRVGRDGDAWQREAPDVLDKQAPIFEPIQVVNPHTEMSVHFAEHAERVPRETWYRLILQECRKVTQADIRIRSIILDRHDTLHILFVMPDVPAMQELTILLVIQCLNCNSIKCGRDIMLQSVKY